MSCELCSGRGWILEDDGGVGSARRCPCRVPENTDRARKRVLRGLGFPDKLTETFQEPAVWPVVLNARGARLESWRGDPWAIYFTGSVGRGKSFLASELAWRWVRARRLAGLPWASARFVSCRAAVDETFGADADPSRLRLPGVLVLDDLGESVRGGQWDALQAVLTDRYHARSPTLVTTNLPLEADGNGRSLLTEFPEGGARLASRFMDGWVVRVTGPDRRGFHPAGHPGIETKSNPTNVNET